MASRCTAPIRLVIASARSRWCTACSSSPRSMCTLPMLDRVAASASQWLSRSTWPGTATWPAGRTGWVGVRSAASVPCSSRGTAVR